MLARKEVGSVTAASLSVAGATHGFRFGSEAALASARLLQAVKVR